AEIQEQALAWLLKQSPDISQKELIHLASKPLLGILKAYSAPFREQLIQQQRYSQQPWEASDIKAQAPPDLSPMAAAKNATADDKPHKVLVIDDEVINRAILVNLLSNRGFDVSEAENGQEGIKAALTHCPDAILMDLLMPVMDGFETTWQMRQLPELKDVIIIAASSTAYAQHRWDSLAAGCNDFLAKPIHIDNLLEKLRIHLKPSSPANQRKFNVAPAFPPSAMNLNAEPQQEI
ncbi:MAG: response regulator, partial [Gammaproteobacteria bacterium]|nr:response regulator [Gammaproteobacteria bacterium]